LMILLMGLLHIQTASLSQRAPLARGSPRGAQNLTAISSNGT
jgi:hypothetical protein